jgi:hypothetical protein
MIALLVELLAQLERAGRAELDAKPAALATLDFDLDVTEVLLNFSLLGY